MVDKTKQGPLPEQRDRPKPIEKRSPDRPADPTFVRGTIDPPTKK